MPTSDSPKTSRAMPPETSAMKLNGSYWTRASNASQPRSPQSATSAASSKRAPSCSVFDVTAK